MNLVCVALATYTKGIFPVGGSKIVKRGPFISTKFVPRVFKKFGLRGPNLGGPNLL